MNPTAYITLDQIKAAYKVVFRQVMGHVSIVQRLDRAYDILTRDTSYQIMYDDKKEHFIVNSPNNIYLVTKYGLNCSCPDSTEKDNICKHRLAIRLILATGVISFEN